MTECQFCRSCGKPVRSGCETFPNFAFVRNNMMPGGQRFVSGFVQYEINSSAHYIPLSCLSFSLGHLI